MEKHGLECDFVVHVGPQIAPLIVQEAKDKDIDIIAMGTHGWTGQTAIVAMGSVARKVLCSSPCPVLIIPPPIHCPASLPIVKSRAQCFSVWGCVYY